MNVLTWKIRRIDGSVICEIEADTFRRVVEIAVGRRIDLRYADLDGAYLIDANLARANLNGAYLSGANLDGANLARANLNGANLNGAKITDNHTVRALVARTSRIIDPHEFFLWATDKGDLVTAGCRTMTLAEYRQHADEYKDVSKREETLAILDYFDAAWVAYEKDNAR